jgi:hypothetical protein
MARRKMKVSNKYRKKDGFVHGDVSATVGLRISTGIADSNLALCFHLPGFPNPAAVYWTYFFSLGEH